MSNPRILLVGDETAPITARSLALLREANHVVECVAEVPYDSKGDIVIDTRRINATTVPDDDLLKAMMNQAVVRYHTPQWKTPRRAATKGAFGKARR